MSDQAIKSNLVYKAINGVIDDLADVGIAKTRENTFDRYKFRGIDEVYNALSKLLAKHKLLILPNVLERTCESRPTKEGGIQYSVVVKVSYDLISSEDGSSHTVICFGEAMDRSDKATNKAFTAAWKYLCFQMFCIPTEQSLDADESSPEVANPKDSRPPQQTQQGSRGTKAAGNSRNQPAQTSKAASGKPGQPEGKQKDPKYGTPLELDALEELSLSIDCISDDVQGLAISKKLWQLYSNKRLTQKQASSLAKSVTAKRAAMVSAGAHNGFETMVDMFTTADLLTKSESTVYKTNTRSRLNMPLNNTESEPA